MSAEQKSRMMKSELGFSTSLLGGGANKETSLQSAVSSDQGATPKADKVITGLGADLGGKTKQDVEVKTKGPWGEFLGV